MSEKEPVDYYISNSIIDVLEETNKYGQQYVESHQDSLMVLTNSRMPMLQYRREKVQNKNIHYKDLKQVEQSLVVVSI